MADKNRVKLVLWFTPGEMEAIRQVAEGRGFGGDNLAAWARETLLTSAGLTPVLPEQPDAGGRDEVPPGGRPKCGCGAARSRNGECDGSCIMRF